MFWLSADINFAFIGMASFFIMKLCGGYFNNIIISYLFISLNLIDEFLEFHDFWNVSYIVHNVVCNLWLQDNQQELKKETLN